jgi:hypothetical protein
VNRDQTISLPSTAPQSGSITTSSAWPCSVSFARGEAQASSDVDLLVEFDGPATFDRFMDLKFHREDLLGTRVDLVTVKALRKQLRPAIEQEAIRVA